MSFSRRSAARLLVDVEMSLRSGRWIVGDADPASAIVELDAVLCSPSSDAAVDASADRLSSIINQAMIDGVCTMPGYEQCEPGDLAEIAHPTAANDIHPALRAA